MKLRIAFREEGALWNAYVAQIGTMEGAVLLGSIAIGAARANTDMKQSFMQLMQRAFADAVARSMGVPIEEWDIARAPETERGGRA